MVGLKFLNPSHPTSNTSNTSLSQSPPPTLSSLSLTKTSHRPYRGPIGAHLNESWNVVEGGYDSDGSVLESEGHDGESDLVQVQRQGEELVDAKVGKTADAKQRHIIHTFI